jgi:hypothetical protein
MRSVVLCKTPSGAKTRPIELRGLAVAELEQTAEALTTLDLACSDPGCLGRDELVAETLVRPLLVIMLRKRAYGRPEVPFAQWHDSLQTLGLGGLDKPFGKRVQIGTPRRKDHWFHATVAQHAPEGRGVERVSVQEDVLNAAQEAVVGVGQVLCDLRHPRPVRLRCDPGISTVRDFSA